MSAGMPPPVFEQAYRRDVAFALELIDAVTLARVSSGVTVVAEGLRGSAVVNAGGLFVWLREDLAPLRRITVDPGTWPLQSATVEAADLALPLTTLQLAPATGYPFSAGTTAVRATLLESNDGETVPVIAARVRLAWLDDDGMTWNDAPTSSRTDAHGDFAALLRLAPADMPRFDANGALTVRLFARRDGGAERSTATFQIPQGRVTDARAYAWDDLQP